MSCCYKQALIYPFITTQEDISDLSTYGIGSANNGGGSDGEEFTFPAIAVTAGSYLYVALESIGFTDFFGFEPDFTSSAMSINGDDAIELFEDGTVVDIYGDINVDGTGSDWEYLDGWAFRNAEASRSNTFILDDWNFSGPNALDGESSNDTASLAIPINGDDGNESDDGTGDDPENTFQYISSVQGTSATQLNNAFGDSDVSPLINQAVTIEAIVVGDFQNNDEDSARVLGGFYLQEEDIDHDNLADSSEGLFVYDNNFGTDVSVGDLVRVSGTVSQYFGETQLNDITSIEILNTNQLSLVSPAIITLSNNTETTQSQQGYYQPDLEAYEGMLVSFSDTLQITEQYQLDRFNEIKLVAGDRPYQFTQLNSPDVDLYQQHQQNLGARRITYDDGLNNQNENVSLLDGFASYHEASAKRMGDSVTGITGILGYKWAGNSASGATWRVRSHIDGTNHFTSTATVDSTNPRPETIDTLAGNLKIASLNVLNFFTTLDDGNTNTATGLSPRGADDLTRFGVEPSTAEFDRQLNKLVKAIVALDADVLSLVELENEFDATLDNSTAIEVLVSAINSRIGSATYNYVYPGREFLGTDAIAVGFIYKPSVLKISANTNAALLDDAVAQTLPVFSSRDFDSNPIFNGPATNRVSLAVSFQHLTSQENFTLVANHFKSKGPSGLSDTADLNFYQQDGAGFWNRRRLDASIAVTEWIKSSPTGLEDNDIIILGDLNAYHEEDPIQYFLNHGFVSSSSNEEYSYVFDGQIGSLDYALISDDFIDRFSESTVWHINADEADALDYNLDYSRNSDYYDTATAIRNSDHDPLILAFNLTYQTTTTQDIFLLFKSLLEENLIEGNGFYFSKHFKLYRFYMMSYFSTIAKHEHQRCHLLAKMNLFSDNNTRPKDLIVGEGRQQLNKLINKAYNDMSCQ